MLLMRHAPTVKLVEGLVFRGVPRDRKLGADVVVDLGGGEIPALLHSGVIVGAESNTSWVHTCIFNIVHGLVRLGDFHKFVTFLNVYSGNAFVC